MTHHRQTSRTELIAELEAAGAAIHGAKIKCPFHDDTRPSASVFQGDDGVWRFKCHACEAKGDVFDIQAKRTGRPLAEILRQNAQDAPQSKNAPRPDPQAGKKPFGSLEAIYGVLAARHSGSLEALHEYTQADGEHVQFVIRWRGADGKKIIWPAVRTPSGLELRAATHRVLYRLPELATAETVIITEGELKTDVLAEYGFPATTSAGGSKAAAKTDWTPLAGKNIIIWPDYDLPGQGYANDVRRILEDLGCSVKLIDPARLDLQEGEDVVNYIQQMKNAGYDELEIKKNLIDIFKNKTHTTGPAAELGDYFSDVINGRIENFTTGFRILDSLIQITPENLILICGNPNAAKSLWMLQMMAYWTEQGIRAACFMLERSRTFHLARALAQRAGIPQLTRVDWIKTHPEQVRRAMAEHRDYIDKLGRSIWTDPEKTISQTDVLTWAKQRAESGHKIIVVDPVTLRSRSGNPWDADEELVQGLKAIAAKYKCAIVTVIHPSKKMDSMPDLSQISGGAVFGRACDCALWLENHREFKTSNVMIAEGFTVTEEVEHDRSIIILKNRDGSGVYSRIACTLSREDLQLYEMGIIITPKKRKKKWSDE